ncbi:MAG: acetyl-CoA carboxylase biotin carboxyl carrier protein subunit [Tannerellaceae bacterium]|nr:acetyl-CoA carboxylase biotin carboxyl carrier protein subunit [Tannerellaceae bacterium]
MEKNEELVDFVVTARKYKTLLTNKYKNRQVWQKPLPGDILSTLPGTIIEVEVQEGEEVQEGQLLLIHEAMKMFNRIVAPVTGKVISVGVKEGDKIGKNHLMVKIEPK